MKTTTLSALFGLTVLLTSILTADFASARPFRLGEGFPGTHITLRLEVSYLLLYGQDSTTDITRHGCSINPLLNFGKVLEVGPLARLTHERLILHQPSNLPADATLVLPTQPSLGFRAKLTVPVFAWMTASMIGEYEQSLGRKRMRLEKLHIHSPEDSALDYNDFVGQDDLNVDRDWKRYLIGLRLQFGFGRFRPFLDVGYRSLTGRLHLGISKKAVALLQLADIEPVNEYDVDLETAYYNLGLEVVLPKGFGCRVNSLFIADSDSFAFFLGIAVSTPSLTLR